MSVFLNPLDPAEITFLSLNLGKRRAISHSSSCHPHGSCSSTTMLFGPQVEPGSQRSSPGSLSPFFSLVHFSLWIKACEISSDLYSPYRQATPKEPIRFYLRYEVAADNFMVKGDGKISHLSKHYSSPKYKRKASQN